MGLEFTIRERKGRNGRVTYMLDLILPTGERYRPTFKTRTECTQAAKQKLAELMRRPVHIESPPPPPPIGPRVKLTEAIRDHMAGKGIEIVDSENLRSLKYIFEYFYDGMFDLGVDFVDQIDRKVLEALRAKWATKGARMGKPLAASTINRRFKSIHHFLDHCVAWKYLPANPWKGVRQLREETNPPPIWPIETYVEILKKVAPWCQDILTFIGDTGCRPKEAINLTESDVNLAEKLVRLQSGKGGGSNRVLPLTENQAYFLAHVIALKKHKYPDQPYIFLRNGQKIFRNRISDEVRRVRHELGLPEKYVPYGLRHTLITLLAEMNVGMSQIQQIAGHKRLDTTVGYIQFSEESLRSVVIDLEKARAARNGTTG